MSPRLWSKSLNVLKSLRKMRGIPAALMCTISPAKITSSGDETDRDRLLTVLFAPFCYPEPQFLGGKVQCVPNKRERFGPRRQLLGSSPLGESKNRESCDSSGERYDEDVDRHSNQRLDTGGKGRG